MENDRHVTIKQKVGEMDGRGEGGGKEGGGGGCVKQTSRDYQVRFSDGFDIAT